MFDFGLFFVIVGFLVILLCSFISLCDRVVYLEEHSLTFSDLDGIHQSLKSKVSRNEFKAWTSKDVRYKC